MDEVWRKVSQSQQLFFVVDKSKPRRYSCCMNKSEAIKKAKGASRLAELLGIDKSAVSRWGDEIPKLRLYELKELKPGWFRKRRANGGA